MARTQFSDVVLDASGNPITTASIRVKDVDEAGTEGADAVIYVSETGSTKSNPFTVDALGFWFFWVDVPKRINVIISAAGFTTRTVRLEAMWIPNAGIQYDDFASVVQQRMFQTGMLIDWTGRSNEVPAGWVAPYGQAVSKTAPPSDHVALRDLYNLAGYPYGSDASNFNLPDYRGRVGVGKDDMGGAAASRVTAGGAPGLNGAVLGAAGGSQEHANTVAQMPAHTHGIRAAQTVFTSGSNATTYNPSAGFGGDVTGSAGSGSPHPNLQPSIIVNKILKL